jgi:hypothetical protein
MIRNMQGTSSSEPAASRTSTHRQESIQLINTVASLFFRDNMMRLYSSRYIIAGHRSDLANGLNLSVSGMYEKRDPLENNTDFSFFRRERPWHDNLPDNAWLHRRG